MTAGHGVRCELTNVDAMLKSAAADADATAATRSEELEDVQLTPRRRALTTHDVEILPILSSPAVSPRLIDSGNDGDDGGGGNQRASLNQQKNFTVLIGSERWLTSNGVTLNDTIIEAIGKERQTGNISVLIAVNGECEDWSSCIHMWH